MEQITLVNRELVSALVDGQLRSDEFARVLSCLQESDDGMSTWHAYHLVGDALRCADLAAGRNDQAFVTRLRIRMLSLEGVKDDAARPRVAEIVSVTPSGGVRTPPPERIQDAAANDPDMRWKWLAGFASLAAVAIFGWHLAGSDAGPGQGMQLSAAPAGSTAGAPPGTPDPAAEAQVMLRDPRLDELLAAHKQLGGTSALQMPAGFLRNATFENPGR